MFGGTFFSYRTCKYALGAWYILRVRVYMFIAVVLPVLVGAGCCTTSNVLAGPTDDCLLHVRMYVL